MSERRSVEMARPKPCAHCPWRVANQGKRHPGGWYTKRNLERLWAGLRRGHDMTCHPTDPDNPVEAEWLTKGVKAAPAGATTTECTGALILKQREFMRFQDLGDVSAYRRTHPRGLTLDGLMALVSRTIRFPGEVKMATPNLNEPGIGAPFLKPWEPRTKESGDDPNGQGGERGVASRQ